jgi:branched-chain amino acid transport system substrate-binding protein
MERFIGNWWASGDDDVRPAGERAKGYRSLGFTVAGTEFPAIRDILTYVVARGKSLVRNRSEVGENLYNRSVVNAALVAEGIATAQRLTGKKVVDAGDMRRGLENIDLNAARLKELGLEGMAHPIRITCQDHSGAHEVYMQAWDGTSWKTASPWFPPMREFVRPMLEEAAHAYAAANQPWPVRTEPCG